MRGTATFACGGNRATLRVILAALTVTWLVPAAGQLFSNGRPARPTVTLPDGAVRQVILRSCTACHGIDEYGYYAMDRTAWNALIERMKAAKSGVVEGAVISDADREVLLDWLVAEFGPDATPFPREYVIPTLTDADLLSNADANALLAKACASCHSPLQRVVSAQLDEAQWRSTLVGKIATGVPILLEDVDPLIEWLLRSPGARAANQ